MPIDFKKNLNFFYRFLYQDIETFDLEDFKYNSVNITAFRLVDIESPKVIEIMEQMKKFQHTEEHLLNRSYIIQVHKKK